MKTQTALLMMLCSASVIAQQPGPPPGGAQQGLGGDSSIDQRPFFDAMDANKDGIVTKSEWVASGMPEQVFSQIDSKNTGKADWEAFKSHPPMSSFDGNGDKVLTLAEMIAALTAQLKNGTP